MGNPAPDFTATAVFDQEFVETKLSQYKVRRQRRRRRLRLPHLLPPGTAALHGPLHVQRIVAAAEAAA